MSKVKPPLSRGLVQQLYEDLSLVPGALTRTTASVEEIPGTFFRSYRDLAGQKRLGQLDAVLAHHQIEGAAFLRRTRDLQYGPLAPLLEDAERLRRRRPNGRRHWVVEEARRVARMTGSESLDTTALDRLRDDDPAAAAHAASVALRKSAGSRAAAQGLGCWASAQRVCYRLDLAVMAIAQAIVLASRYDLDDVLANLVERAVYITMDRGEYEWALELALDAHARQALRCDLNAMAETMVTTAVVLGQLGQPARAVDMATAALPFIEEKPQYRAAAFCVIGIDRANLGDLDGAEKALEECRHTAAGRRARGRASWLQAGIAVRRENLEQAERGYREAVRAMTEPVDALLVGVELMGLLLKRGKPSEAVDIAKTHLLRLHEPLSRDPLDENRLLVAALTELVRAALGAQLTSELAATVAAQIHEARTHRRASLRQQIAT